jgi:methionine synthase II (cobalamin-independent)
MTEILNGLPRENCYAGFKLNEILASGACNVFSKDVIRKIAETDIEQIPYKDNYDDVAISNLLTDTYKIYPQHIDRYDLSINRVPTEAEMEAAISYPMVRVRNNVNRELFDVQIWETLFKLYRLNYFAQQN